MTTDTIPQAVRLTIAEYNDARIRTALMDRLCEKGLPVKWEPVVCVVAPATHRPGTPEPLWPPSGIPGRDDGGGISPEKPSKSGGDSCEGGRPALNGHAAKEAYLTTPGRPTRRAGLAGGLEVYRGAFRGECWMPSLFGALLRTPRVISVREACERLTVTIGSDALRPVAELFGFRAPARTVELLEAAARQRVYRARRCRQGPSGRGEFWVKARSWAGEPTGVFAGC